MEYKERHNFLSANELMKYRKNASKTLPNRGCKNSEFNEIAVQKLYQEQEEILSEERVEKLGSLCVAEYDDETKQIELQKNLGKIWQKMGFSQQGKKYLHPEEALFLLESVRLEVYRNKLPLSVQEAYALFLDDNCTLEHFQVYSHLSRLGYIVVRYNEKCNEASSSHDKRCENKINSSCKRNSETLEIIIDKEDESLPENVSSDDKDGLYIVYESLQNKKFKLQNNKAPGEGSFSSFMCNTNQNNMNNDNENLFYEFPNLAGKSSGTIRISLPPERLLPPNVRVTESMCVINIEKIHSTSKKEMLHWEDRHQNSKYNWKHQRSKHQHSPHYKFNSRNSPSHHNSNQAKRRIQTNCMQSNFNPNNDAALSCSLARLCQENNIQSWKEYKQFLISKQNKEDLLQSPATHLWTGLQTPLIQPKDGISSEAVRERLSCVKTLSGFSSLSSLSLKSPVTKYKIDYNVYLPQTNYKKSSPPVPNHRVVVLKNTDSVPTLEDLAALRVVTNDNIPLHFAVVDNGSISVYSFNDISLPEMQ